MTAWRPAAVWASKHRLEWPLTPATTATSVSGSTAENPAIARTSYLSLLTRTPLPKHRARVPSNFFPSEA
jgi:hypothetical protein